MTTKKNKFTKTEQIQRQLIDINDHMNDFDNPVRAALNKIDALESLEATKPFHADLQVLRHLVGDVNSTRFGVEQLLLKLNNTIEK